MTSIRRTRKYTVSYLSAIPCSFCLGSRIADMVGYGGDGDDGGVELWRWWRLGRIRVMHAYDWFWTKSEGRIAQHLNGNILVDSKHLQYCYR